MTEGNIRGHIIKTTVKSYWLTIVNMPGNFAEKTTGPETVINGGARLTMKHTTCVTS